MKKLKIEKLIDDLSFSKEIEEEKYTTNNFVFNRLFRRFLGCPFCGPHSGCNTSSKYACHRSWKKYRDHQWKEKSYGKIREEESKDPGEN